MNTHRMKLWNAVGRLPVSLREGHGGNGGQALVELALVTTVMFLLLVGALDLGRVFYGQIVVTDAAKEGALVASQGGTRCGTVQQFVGVSDEIRCSPETRDHPSGSLPFN